MSTAHAMASSSSISQSRSQDIKFSLDTGEVVTLKSNDEIFNSNGHLRQQARFVAEKASQLFTLFWPRHSNECVSMLSRWRLVITKATSDHIASFTRDTAENLGLSNWMVVKQVVEDCRKKFNARLLLVTTQEIVFTHKDEESAKRMKNSNEMVDTMKALLADVERSTHESLFTSLRLYRRQCLSDGEFAMFVVKFTYCDILVDWDVTVTPVTESLSYLLLKDVGQQYGIFSSWLPMDGDSPSVMSSSVSETASVSEEVPPHFQKVLDALVSENRNTRAAIDKLSKESSERHHIVCQKIEELKSSLQVIQRNLGRVYKDSDIQSEQEFDQIDLTFCKQTGNPEEDSIPTENLLGEPQRDSSFPRIQMPQDVGQQSHIPLSSTPKCTTRLLQGENANHPQTFHDSLTDLENMNLEEAIERAYKDDDEPVPRAKSYCTLLCLDVSSSMTENDSFREMKEIVDKFIDGVEDVVNDTGLEENIGVVAFGRTSTVVQNLTNDFARIRDAVDKLTPGGRSPFIQALLVAMAAFKNKANVISISGVYDVRPRIIFISDGYPTENLDDGEKDYAYNMMHVRTSLTRLMMKFASSKKYRKVHPIIYIPVGKNPDKELMRSMATLSCGQYLEPSEIDTLYGYFLLEETIGKTLACMKRVDDYSQEQIEALVSGLTPGLDDKQKELVVKRVQQEREAPSKLYESRMRKISDLEDTFENADKVNAGELLPLGTRVVRGPDWHFHNQDKNGPGTVYSHSDEDGWTYVAWDGGGYNRYEYGPDMGYQIWKTDEHPRLMGEGQDLEIGMRVKKGPHWNSTEKRLQNFETGVVIRKSGSQGKLMIRWDNAELQVVRWGDEEKYDVMYCDPTQIPDPTEVYKSRFTFDHPLIATEYATTNSILQPSEGRRQWQWRDIDGTWIDYSLEHNTVIEKSFKLRPGGTCVIIKDGSSRRVMFRRMTEKTVDSGFECAVRYLQIQ